MTSTTTSEILSSTPNQIAEHEKSDLELSAIQKNDEKVFKDQNTSAIPISYPLPEMEPVVYDQEPVQNDPPVIIKLARQPSRTGQIQGNQIDELKGWLQREVLRIMSEFHFGFS
jgi:hypothetical protein